MKKKPLVEKIQVIELFIPPNFKIKYMKHGLDTSLPSATSFNPTLLALCLWQFFLKIFFKVSFMFVTYSQVRGTRHQLWNASCRQCAAAILLSFTYFFLNRMKCGRKITTLPLIRHSIAILISFNISFPSLGKCMLVFAMWASPLFVDTEAEKELILFYQLLYLCCQ